MLLPLTSLVIIITSYRSYVRALSLSTRGSDSRFKFRTPENYHGNRREPGSIGGEKGSDLQQLGSRFLCWRGQVQVEIEERSAAGRCNIVHCRG